MDGLDALHGIAYGHVHAALLEGKLGLGASILPGDVFYQVLVVDDKLAVRLVNARSTDQVVDMVHFHRASVLKVDGELLLTFNDGNALAADGSDFHALEAHVACQVLGIVVAGEQFHRTLEGLGSRTLTDSDGACLHGSHDVVDGQFDFRQPVIDGQGDLGGAVHGETRLELVGAE